MFIRRYHMARGRKPALTLEEQLAKITEEIENMKVSLKELEKTKKELEEQIKMNRLSELDELIADSGLSYDEVKELIYKKYFKCNQQYI